MKRERRGRTALYMMLAVLLIGSGTGFVLMSDVERVRQDSAGDTGTTKVPRVPRESDEKPAVEPGAGTKPSTTPDPAPAPEAVEPEKEEAPKLSFFALRRLKANETAAVATLRNISSAQSQFQASAVADEDGDGTGEFGTFGEMSGGVAIRGTDKPIMPPVLSGAFKSVVHDGVVERSGYRYRIYLPAIGGGWTTEDYGGGLTAGRVDIDRAERLWRIVAWPIEPGTTGRRTLFIDQAGDIWSSPDDEMPTEAPTDLSMPDQETPSNAGSKVAPDGRRWRMAH